MVHESCEIFVQVLHLVERCYSTNIAVRTNNDNCTGRGNAIGGVGLSAQIPMNFLLIDEYPAARR